MGGVEEEGCLSKREVGLVEEEQADLSEKWTIVALPVTV